MVVFTCNNCGDSLQKPKVAKHYQFQCHTSIFVTCIDCLKDFRGEEYTVHTKCITENERYGGKNYVPTKSLNKGEKKQQAWITIVQNVLTNSTNLTVPERNILNSISRYENIPRKKTKFMNFIRNMSNNRVNMTIAESVWDKMEKAFKEVTSDTNIGVQKNENQNVIIEENQNNFNICKENENVEEINITQENNEVENKKNKKSKKRLLETDENRNCYQISKRKNKINKMYATQEDNTYTYSLRKFSWKNAIYDVVTTKREISLKKLKKKVMAQYLAHFPDVTSEKAASKFEKKLSKVSNISIIEDKVKLSLD